MRPPSRAKLWVPFLHVLFLESVMQYLLGPDGTACAAYEEAEHGTEPFPLQGSDGRGH